MSKKVLDYIKKNIYAIIFSGVAGIFFNIIINMLDIVEHDQSFQNVSDELNSMTYGQLLLISCVIAVIIEELVFRKLIFKTICRRFMKFVPAAIISSLIFGLAHLNITQFIYAFLMGLIFSYAYELTGTIFTSMLMHSFSNFMTLSVLLMIPGKEEGMGPIIFTLLICISLAYMCFYRWHEMYEINPKEVLYGRTKKKLKKTSRKSAKKTKKSVEK